VIKHEMGRKCSTRDDEILAENSSLTQLRRDLSGLEGMEDNIKMIFIKVVYTEQGVSRGNASDLYVGWTRFPSWPLH
jgi:hypothetical protein